MVERVMEIRRGTSQTTRTPETMPVKKQASSSLRVMQGRADAYRLQNTFFKIQFQCQELHQISEGDNPGEIPAVRDQEPAVAGAVHQ